MNAKNIEYDGKKYTEYEISQMQRKFERDIRSLKREAAAYDTARNNAPDDKVKQQFSDDFTAVSVTDGLNASQGAKGLRGAFSLERMKADHLDEIEKGAKEKFT